MVDFSFTDQQAVTHSDFDPFPQYVGTGPANAAYLPGALVFSYPQTIKPTYVMQYNLSVERQVGANWLLSITYWGISSAIYGETTKPIQGFRGPALRATRFLRGSVPQPAHPCLAVVIGTTNCVFRRYLNANVCSPIKRLSAEATAEPVTAKRFFWKKEGPETTTVCSSRPSTNSQTTIPRRQISHGRTAFRITRQRHWAIFRHGRGALNRHADRGNCPSTDTHNIFNQSLVAETPKFSNHTEEMILGHWRFSVSAIVQSGTDLSGFEPGQTCSSILQGMETGSSSAPTWWGLLIVNQRGEIAGSTPRLSLPHQAARPFTSRPPLWAPRRPSAIWVTTACSGQGRSSSIRGCRGSSRFGDHQQVEFRWEVFNLPNHVNLYPSSGLGAGIFPTFGQPTAASIAGLGALSQTSQRSADHAVRIEVQLLVSTRLRCRAPAICHESRALFRLAGAVHRAPSSTPIPV